MRPEETIEKRFVTECFKLGIPALKFEIRCDKGWPDRIVLMPTGKPIFIEFKQPGGQLSEHQKEKITQLRTLNYDVKVYDNWEKALEYVKDTLHTG